MSTPSSACARGQSSLDASAPKEAQARRKVGGVQEFLSRRQRRILDGVVTFAFELYVARERAACLDELAARVQAAAEELRKAGTAVRYLRSIYLPEDETCFVLAEASSQPAAVQLSKRAALDSVRILEAALPTSRRREGAGTRSDERQGFAKVSARTPAENRRLAFAKTLTTGELEGEGKL